jgi:hypothetical protein
MNRKDIEIIRMLKDEKTYTEIQRKLKVSPNRISLTKEFLAEIVNVDPKLLKSPSVFDSENNKQYIKNDSEYSKTIVKSANIEFRNDENDSKNQMTGLGKGFLPENDREGYQEFLKIEKQKAENEKVALQIKEIEILMREQELKNHKIKTEELFFKLDLRLKRIIQDFDIKKLDLEFANRQLNDLADLKYEYEELSRIHEKPFIETTIDKIFNMLTGTYEKMRKELLSQGEIQTPLMYTLDQTEVKTKWERHQKK